MMISQVVLILSMSQVIFLAISSLMFQRNTYIGKLLIAFALSTLAYLLYIFYDLQNGSVFAYIVGRASYLIPGLIWLIAFTLFRQEKKVPLYAWVLIGVYFILKAIGQFFYITNPDILLDKFVYTFFHILPQSIIVGIYIHTLSLALLEYKQDLIESRRNLRVQFVATLGIFWLWVCIDVLLTLLLSMGLESLLDFHSVVQIVRNIFVFPAIFAVNIMFFKINVFTHDFGTALSLSDSSTSQSETVIDSKDYALKEKLLEYMDKELPYRETGLTIRKLSEYMGVQEYRLRSVINKVLKYHNFSHFLNKYRIKEAESMLLNSKDSIFSIGINAGYTSLSSFHKAFKDKHGITPKEYRILAKHPRDYHDKKIMNHLLYK